LGSLGSDMRWSEPFGMSRGREEQTRKRARGSDVKSVTVGTIIKTRTT
jgi:hypothetical protein